MNIKYNKGTSPSNNYWNNNRDHCLNRLLIKPFIMVFCKNTFVWYVKDIKSMGRLLFASIILLYVYSVTAVADVHRYKMPPFDSPNASMETVVKWNPNQNIIKSWTFKWLSRLSRAAWQIHSQDSPTSKNIYRISLWLESLSWFWMRLKINGVVYNQFNAVSGNTYERTHFMWDDVWL